MRIRQRKNMVLGLLSFVLPVAVMLVIFIIKGIYPFGGRSFLSTDLYHQYMPFYSEFVRAVKSGQGVSYTWNVGIGTNFLALYVYYLASPFHWLGFLVPEQYLMEFLTYLVVVKIGLCGLSAFWYFKGRAAELGITALFFSLCYALSGFLAAYNWNIMWIDCVILLPVIMRGVERLVREGRPGLYCVALGLSIFTNFYISIMICIFLVLYFLVLYCTERHPMPDGNAGRARRWAAHIKPIGQFALYSLLAGGMAAVLLLPEVCALLATDFGDISFPDKVESYFSVLDMLARHCVAVSVEKGLDHWPNIYCGAGVFLFVPLYALNGRIPARKRFGMLALAGVFLLGFGTSVLNFIWHGLNYPDSLPARQSFIYILLVLAMCQDACVYLEPGEKTAKERVVHIYLGAVAALLFVEKFVEHEDFLPGVEWLTLLFVTLYAALLYLGLVHGTKRWRTAVGWIAMTAVVAETGINTYCTSVSNVSRAAYLEYQEDYRSLYEWTREQEKGFYRLEKFTRKTKNDGTLTGYPTASVFSSTMNSAVMDLYERLGMRHSKVFYGYDGATALTSALLNVKYLFGESDGYENALYRVCNESGGISLYRAEYALPFGYVAPTGYDLPEGFSYSGLRLQNQMVHDLGIEGQLFVKCDGDFSGENIRFAAPEDGVYYGIISASGTRKVKVTGGSLSEQNFQDLKRGSVLYLGYLEQGNLLFLKNGDEDDQTKEIEVDIYRMDEAVLRETISVLSRNQLEEVSYDSTRIAGSLQLEQAGRLILSVPYEKGWSVTLNGERVEPELFGGALMAFDLQPGNYELRMRYVPYGKYAGMAVSAVSICCFAALMWFGRRRRKFR
ncbi:MAG: YfhO family protein [Muribaculum sp.]|nr:YfhO family protein [Muribaculum sp.]